MEWRLRGPGDWDQESEHLTEATERLLRKCGDHADLVIDCVFTKAHHFHPAIKFAQQITTEQLQAGRALWEAPMLRALQTDRAECGCSPLGRLSVLSSVLSGSQMEGFGDTEVTVRLQSDHDTMIELGPVRWAPVGAGAGQPGAGQPDEAETAAAPSLALAATENPGFVRVLQTPRPECPHREPLPFSAASVRRLMQERARLRLKPGAQLATSGPATALSERHTNRVAGLDDDDLVPCLHAPVWPAEEFLTRRRARDWPPAAARENIRRFGVHLVPTGCRGSATEQTEWRLSFSRAEVVAAWHLNEVQRCALLALKACKAGLGPDGKGVKSYFMKTAMFWLCQETPDEHWRSVTEGALLVLDHLEAAVDARRLPCFFWADINLLRLLSPQELEAMRCTLGLMRREMTRLLMRSCADLHMRTVRPLLASPGEPLSERQLRACLARSLVVEGAASELAAFMMSNIRLYISSLIPALLRSSAVVELRELRRQLAVTTGLPVMLWRAMRVAPDDVFGAARLERRGAHSFSWDTAPLMTLLTAEDLQLLLYQPAAVQAWWRNQRPDVLPDDPLSPRGLARLVLDAPLRAYVISKSVPGWLEVVQRADAQHVATWRAVQREELPPYEEARWQALEDCRWDLGSALERLAIADGPTAGRLAAQWREDVLRHWSDPGVRTEYHRIRTTVLDAWQLRPFARLPGAVLPETDGPQCSST